MTEDNLVKVGLKEIPVYVRACMMTIERSGSCVIKTRGKHISKAFDLATYLIRAKNLKQSDLEMGSESFVGNDGKERFVSTFSVKLKR